MYWLQNYYQSTYLVHVSHTLAVVELSVLSGVHTLNLDEALIFILSNLASMPINQITSCKHTFCSPEWHP